MKPLRNLIGAVAEFSILKKNDLNQNRKIVNIFDESTYQKDLKPKEIDKVKENNEITIKEKEEKEIKEKDNKEKENEEKIYTNKLAKIVEEITKHRILIKLKNNIMSLVEGKIIMFSDLIKYLCSYNSFNYRINLDELNRDNFELILDFLDIIEWNKSRFIWDNKEDELNKWYNSLDNVSEIEEVINILYIIYYFLFILILFRVLDILKWKIYLNILDLKKNKEKRKN
jgi:hypothetical protein